MALTGSMRDFGISEILQMIGHQKKSGELVIKDESRTVSILIDQGSIVGAKHDPYDECFDLGSLLVRSGLISHSQLEAAQKEQEASLKPMEQILVSTKALDFNELKSMSTLSHTETIYSLFLWKDGDYSFEAKPVTYPQQWTEPISSEQVLMDGYRIKDEWPLIEQVIPDQRIKLSKATGEEPQGSLQDDQRKIYNLVDGNRTAEDLVFISRMGRFEALKIIKVLIENGRLVAGESEEAMSARDLKAISLQAAAVLVLALGLFAVTFGAWQNIERVFFPDDSEPGTRARQMLWAWHQKDRVSTALSMYAAVNGGYPESLEQLVQADELGSSDLRTGWGRLEYHVGDGGRSCRLQVSKLPEEGEDGADESGSPGGG